MRNDHNCECSVCAARFAALYKLAAFNDKSGSERLKTTGSFGGFDEPNAVEVARKLVTQHD